jgi:hypothetical protein
MEYLPERIAFGLALLLVPVSCGPRKPVSPDLTIAAAAELITRASEFGQYAELVSVDSTTRDGDSLADCCYSGRFTFRYRDAGAKAELIKAQAQFRYYDATWHFTHFDYGCPTNCQWVTVASPAMKGRTPY